MNTLFEYVWFGILEHADLYPNGVRHDEEISFPMTWDTDKATFTLQVKESHLTKPDMLVHLDYLRDHGCGLPDGSVQVASPVWLDRVKAFDTPHVCDGWGDCEPCDGTPMEQA